MSSYYVILTGGKNNSGDFLIKSRAASLLKSIRPDREIIEFNGWEPLNAERLDFVNKANALILTGGPSVQKRMYPGVYALTQNLNEIRVPITAFGVGIQSADDTWANTRKFEFTPSAKLLLNRIIADGLDVSVRDFHTRNVLVHEGMQKVVMTGCPALYKEDGIPVESKARLIAPEVVAFSPGVMGRSSKLMLEQNLRVAKALRELFPLAKFKVAFHQSLKDEHLAVPGYGHDLLVSQRYLAGELQKVADIVEDISGGAEGLKDFYKDIDLHVGYRVHAHIFCASQGIPSILLAEDARATALSKVLSSALVVPAFDSSLLMGPLRKVVVLLKRIGIRIDPYAVRAEWVAEVAELARNEWTVGVEFAKQSNAINAYRPQMVRFLAGLP